MALIEAIGDEEAHRTPTAGASAPKRVVDLLLGVPLCVVAVPVIAVLALLMAVQLRCSPFFVHDRVGQGGRTVRIPKLRTLPASTPHYADKTVSVLRPPTRLAAFLRRSHLDELPQLFLVPIGKLSLVGPRPVMPAELALFGDPVAAEVGCSVPQGCTGLWQVSVAQRARVADHPEYALFYVVQRTTRLDLWILWRTIAQALGARPIELHDVPRWALRSPEHAPVLAAS